MTRGLGLGRTLALAAACTSVALSLSRTAAGARTPHDPAAAPTISGVAAQLGVRVHPQGSDAFGIGTSFTGSLRDPGKLAGFGLPGFHQGARVTVVRMAPERVLVDADEDEPATLRKTARLHIDAEGTLSVPLKS